MVLTIATWIPLIALDGAVGFSLRLAHLTATCLQMGLFAAALALGTQAAAPTAGRRTVGIATAVAYAVASYIVYGLSASVHWLAHLRPLTLWRWYLSNDPLSEGAGLAEIAVLCSVCIIALALGLVGFQRRDLRA